MSKLDSYSSRSHFFKICPYTLFTKTKNYSLNSPDFFYAHVTGMEIIILCTIFFFKCLWDNIWQIKKHRYYSTSCYNLFKHSKIVLYLLEYQRGNGKIIRVHLTQHKSNFMLNWNVEIQNITHNSALSNCQKVN